MLKQWFSRVSRQVARYNAMLQGFERANSQAIDPAMAYVQWGVNQADTGDITGSIDKFRQAVSLSPNRPEGYTNWGVALAKLGQLEDAIDKFEQAIQRAPHHATNYMLLGAALLEKGDLEAAAAQYSKATELDPTNPSPLINHGVALARIDQHADAISQFKKALSLQKHQPHVYFLWGAALAELGQHSDAIDKFRQTVRYIPKHVEALSFWAVSLNELGQYQEALTKAQDVLALDADRPDVYLTIGDALANLGQLEPALQAFEQALQLDPSLIDATISMGMVHAQLGHWEQAEAAFETAHQMDTEDMQVQRAWGLYLAQAAQTDPGKYMDVLAKLQPYCKAFPDDWSTRVQLAAALVHTGQWREAEAEINQLLIIRPYDADTLTLKAQLLQHQGLLTEARQQLEQAFQSQPTADRAVQLAQHQLANRQPADAIRLLRPWYRKQPDYLPVSLTYAIALRGDGQAREAVEKLNVLLALHPNHVGVLEALTETYLTLGQPDAAMPLVQALLTRHAELPMTRWLQCWTLLQQYVKAPSNDQLVHLQQAEQALSDALPVAHVLTLPCYAVAAFIAGETATAETGLTQFDQKMALFLATVSDVSAKTYQKVIDAYRLQLQGYWAQKPKPASTLLAYPLFG